MLVGGWVDFYDAKKFYKITSIFRSNENYFTLLGEKINKRLLQVMDRYP